MDSDPKQNVRQLVGICGLYCGTCPNYLAYRENDEEQLRRISEETGIPIGDIRCDGCLSETVFPPCKDCRHGFRQCARGKNVTWCFQCDEFPCQRLTAFRTVHIVNGISHHAHIIEDLQYMKEHGVERWAEDQEDKGRCPECGKVLYWYVRTCPGCHTPIR
jgi:hypothetical protein